MWIFLTPRPRPDVPIWRGRRVLALADALGWPLFWAVLLVRQGQAHGLLEAVLLWALLLLAARRGWRAWLSNASYRFTTWTWAKYLGALFLLGVMLRWCLPVR